jgi:hypothetical protein
MRRTTSIVAAACVVTLVGILPTTAAATSAAGYAADLASPAASVSQGAPAVSGSPGPARAADGGSALRKLIVAVALAAMAVSLVSRFRAGRRLFDDDDRPGGSGAPGP